MVLVIMGINMNARFLTDKSRTGYLEKDLYFTEDNTLYQSKDGTIYIVPRGFVTDFYSIPDMLAWITGDSAERDPRPAIVHDFGCAFHGLLKVRMTVNELIQYGYLTKHYSELRKRDFTVCNDIPSTFLEFIPMDKGQVNNILDEAMEALKVPRRQLIRAGVCFNFNWYWTGQQYDMSRVYTIYNHYKRKGLKNET